jgi:hypothetical protein
MGSPFAHTLPVDFAVRSAQRSPSGLLEHVNGDGRIPARCQLAAGVLPGESAIGHFAHEAGRVVQPGGASDGFSLKRVESIC